MLVVAGSNYFPPWTDRDLDDEDVTLLIRDIV